MKLITNWYDSLKAIFQNILLWIKITKILVHSPFRYWKFLLKIYICDECNIFNYIVLLWSKFVVPKPVSTQGQSNSQVETKEVYINTKIILKTSAK